MSDQPKKETGNPVTLVFAGGFLGSGKTTALSSLARLLVRQGAKVGVVTNDQSQNLVDTLIVREMLSEIGVPVEEVAEGCFCCKFDKLMNTVHKIRCHSPDYILGEPVGSCTDFVAAVANPIRSYYKEAFRIAPFSILVDPERVRSLILNETENKFPEEIPYLFYKQIEEADILALNKIDLLPQQETERLIAVLQRLFPDKRVLGLSAADGEGVAEWLTEIQAGTEGAAKTLQKIDYAQYATAEAVLGWLNASIQIRSEISFDGYEMAWKLAAFLQEECRKLQAEIGHLKFAISAREGTLWANVAQSAGKPLISGKPSKDLTLTKGTMLLNARVNLSPDKLEDIVRTGLSRLQKEMGIRFEISQLQSFSPLYPNPPHLMREPGI